MPHCDDGEKSLDSKSKKLENIERTVRTRVECEERAFQIVNKLIDRHFSGAYLIECGRLINKEHYDDIVEERAINQLCGYPICPNKLGKTPNKKYHVSTKTNKVYEISERKNFCSNQCLKASRHFQCQIPDSPLWMRDKESPATINLLEHDGNKGIVGDEIIGLNPKQILKDKLESLEELDKKTSSKKHDVKSSFAKNVFKRPNSADDESQKEIGCVVLEDLCVTGTNAFQSEAHTVADRSILVAESDLTDSISVEGLKSSDVRPDKGNNLNVESDLPLLTQQFNQMTTNERLRTENCIPENLPDSNKSAESCQVERTEAHKRNNQSLKLDHLKALLSKRKNMLLNMVDVQTLDQTQRDKEIGSKVPSTPDNVQNQGSLEIKQPNKLVDVQPENKTNISSQANTRVHSSGKPSPLLHVCDVLKSWISPGTRDYLITHSNNSGAENSQFSDPQIQQGYGALCHRLAAQEKRMEALLDGALGADTEQASRPTKPVPDYKVLREETEAYTLNVIEFITGKKQVVAEGKYKAPLEDSGICLPTVDAYDQHQIRVRIVMDRLDKSLPEVLVALGLYIQDVSSPIREMVQTCRLEKDNIVLKPGEWTLAALLILKMLASRYPMIQSAFATDSATRHFSAVLSRLGHDYRDLEAHILNILDGSQASSKQSL